MGCQAARDEDQRFRIVLIPRMTSGHFGAPGRFKALEEVAMFQAFALDVMGKR